MISAKLILTALVTLLVLDLSEAYDVSILKSIRECFQGNKCIVCLKEKLLMIIDEALTSDQPLEISDFVDIVRDPNYKLNTTEDEAKLPKDPTERSEKLNDLLTKRVDDFFESRTIKFNLAKVVEGIYDFIYRELESFYEGTIALNLNFNKKTFHQIFGNYNNYIFNIVHMINTLLPNMKVNIGFRKISNLRNIFKKLLIYV